MRQKKYLGSVIVMNIMMKIKDEWYPVLIMGDLEGFMIVVGKEGQSTEEFLEEVEELMKERDGRG